MRQVFGFGLVGVAGFLTDALLFLLSSQVAGIAIMPSRALSFLPATGVTWLLNRHYVFRTAGGARSRRGEYLRHLAIQSVGIAINFGTFYLAVHAGLGKGSAQLVPLALGSGVAMVFNYVGARRLVFLR